MRRFSLLAILAAACGSSPTPPKPPTPPVPPTGPSAPSTPAAPNPPPIEGPGMRLGDAATPHHYRVDLTLIPDRESFTGKIDIDLELKDATHVLWLNGQSLTISDARLGDQPARVAPLGEELIGFSFDRPVGPGPALLHIEYAGKVSSLETEGIFRQKTDDSWYVFSQFEATSARLAFPCFDEPAFKATWKLTLHVPKDDLAVANTAATGETAEDQGMKAVSFAETKPLSSYLIAFGVGPFDVIDGGKSKSGTPLRIIVPRGQADQARWAVEPTRKILDVEEEYFGIPYPFGKLDSLNIPTTVAFGAMENPGLITYSSTYLMAKPGDLSWFQEHHYATGCAHEIAHQWFGDLVTMDWWNDIWLNESFASWMETKITAILNPSWGEDVERVRGRSQALAADSIASARAIRQPIHDAHDIADAFDHITYEKGEAVLEMFEAYLGPAVFQKGVRRYLAQHSWGNATAADFLAALSAEAGFDVGPSFSTFLDQAGAPLVTAELACPAGGEVKVRLSQRRYLPLGSADSAQRLWHIPLCVRYQAAGATATDCAILAAPEADLPLTHASGCPDWIFANADEAGYYRVSYTSESLAKLMRAGLARLSAAEKVGLIGDVQALIDDNSLPAGNAIRALMPVLADPDRHITKVGIELIRMIRPHLVPADLRPRYAALVRKLYGARAGRIGLLPRKGEPAEARMLRGDLVGFVANEGEDPQLVAQARKLALAWLAERKSLDENTSRLVLGIAAHHGDQALFDRILEAARREKDVRERRAFLFALGQFRDPKLVQQALALLISPEFDVREALIMLYARGGSDEETRKISYDFTKLHFDELAARMPTPIRHYLLRASGLCDEAHRRDYEAFFKPRAEKLLGGPRSFTHSLEEIDQCVANKRAQEPSIRAFLQHS